MDGLIGTLYLNNCSLGPLFRALLAKSKFCVDLTKKLKKLLTLHILSYKIKTYKTYLNQVKYKFCIIKRIGEKMKKKLIKIKDNTIYNAIKKLTEEVPRKQLFSMEQETMEYITCNLMGKNKDYQIIYNIIIKYYHNHDNYKENKSLLYDWVYYEFSKHFQSLFDCCLNNLDYYCTNEDKTFIDIFGNQTQWYILCSMFNMIDNDKIIEKLNKYYNG